MTTVDEARAVLLRLLAPLVGDAVDVPEVDALIAAVRAESAVLLDDTVCACLHETGERKVKPYDRCMRCGAFMVSEDRAESAEAKLAALREAAETVVAQASDEDGNFHRLAKFIAALAALAAIPAEEERT